MKVTAPEEGLICQSLQGRDKGCFYAVTRVLQNGFILVADGTAKRLENPKKKNLKHIRLTPYKVWQYAEMDWGKVKDYQIAFALKSYINAQSQNNPEDK